MWPTALFALLTKVPSTVFSLFTGINFSSVLTGVGSFLSGVVANVKAHWQIWLVVLLVSGNLFTSWEWSHTAAALIKEKAAHAADIASFKKAQAEADAKAQQERAILQKESKANADQADANYSGLLTRYHTSLLRYAQVRSGTKGPSNYQLPTAESSDGPGPSADLPATITISGNDAQICAINTARLEAVHDWAVNLPKTGDLVK